MSNNTRLVIDNEDGMRLDRWLRLHFPRTNHTQIEKLVRTGQVRLDGSRTKSNIRVSIGQTVRIPPKLIYSGGIKRPSALDANNQKYVRLLKENILYKDDNIIAINKPSGLAVQGGTRTRYHIDGILDSLRFGGIDRPRLVHRLDKDTSGVLILARDRRVASHLMREFKSSRVEKTYSAIVAGVVTPPTGVIKTKLNKKKEGLREKMSAGDRGKLAITNYRVIQSLPALEVTWLVLKPVTGRTHQLRVHCSELGSPIVGDKKYGRPISQLRVKSACLKKLQLHASSIRLFLPKSGWLALSAPFPSHMEEALVDLGFDFSQREEALL
ncbi:MAG: RluA family pseudouridine synthase [Pseudomonadota bacterium]|nr:RluA family pseudouridine synthase [Pseudomonadota bacterium]